MLLELNDEQESLLRTTTRFLDDNASVEDVRRLRDEPAGFLDDYWRHGAGLGWLSLLVSEEHGGITASDSGLVDLTLVAYEFGRHAAPGPLCAASVVAGALSAAGSHEDLLEDVMVGSALATWCLAEPAPHDGLTRVSLDIRVQGGDVVLNGVKRPVESAASARHLLVTGRTGDGLTQVVVPAATPGVTITPLTSVDLTRRFSTVRFDNVRLPAGSVLGELGQAGPQVERQLQQALVILNAETTGAMQRALDMTLEWAFDRYSFGRPLASYQALKHRFAHMATWLEAGHAIGDEAARAASEGHPDAGELSSAAKAYLGDQGTELLQEAVQLHGGIGVTFEHDLHLFLRRVTLNRTLFGTPDVHRRRIAGLIADKEAARAS